MKNHIYVTLILCCNIFGILSFEIVNQWNLLNFDLPYDVGPEISDIRLENTVFTGLEMSEDRFFIATPRLRAGVPATLSTISRNTPRGSSPILRAYPDWSMHGVLRGDLNCSGLISVYRIKTDSCQRLWVLDSGVVTSIDDFRMVCPPKIVIFDIHTDQIVRTIVLPRQVARTNSLLTNLIIDEEVQGACDSAFVYMSDTASPGIVVYDARSERSWRLFDPSFFPDPDFGNYNIEGETFTLMDGVVGLAHSPYLGILFYQPLATDRIFSIPTSAITKGPQAEFEQLPVSLVGRKSSQGLGITVNVNDDTLYFSPMTETSVASWNPVTNRQTVLAHDPKRLQFLAEMRWKPDGSIWVLSTRFQKFFKRTISPSEVNLRLIRIPADGDHYSGGDNFIYY
ncbi:hypothetical protein NQ317_012538 [Molorchus minor]|uniref:Uncharacterized protein n=1 Tax=Molorchus minor TaxID=1323400 RepID=A0ABQ9K470_9CUCU|nr:hypothetical protein NQ317_012538 [Molorchus minor]